RVPKAPRALGGSAFLSKEGEATLGASQPSQAINTEQRFHVEPRSSAKGGGATRKVRLPQKANPGIAASKSGLGRTKGRRCLGPKPPGRSISDHSTEQNCTK